MIKASMEDSRLGVCVNCCYSSSSVNCHIPEIENQIDKSIVYEIPFETVQGIENSIKVKQVLVKVFKLNYLHEGAYEGQLESSLLGDDDVGLCQVCAKVLSILFDNYNKFNCLGQQNSHLATTISRLDEQIHHLQTVYVESQCENQSCQLQQKKARQSIPIKSEFMSQNDHFQDDVASPSTSDCVFNEDYLQVEMDNNIYLKSTLNNSDNIKTGTSIKPVLLNEPIVRVERLTKLEIDAAINGCRRSGRNKNIQVNNSLISVHQHFSNDDDEQDEIMKEDNDDEFHLDSAFLSNEEIESDWKLSEKETNDRPSSSSRIKRKRKKRKLLSSHESKDDTKTWDCVLCPESFKMSTDLSKHLVTHVPDPSNKSCPLCSTIFNSRWSVLDHLRDTHYKVGNLSCPICPKSFITKRKRSKHLTCHWPTGQFTCHFCLEIFSSKSSMVDHMSQCEYKSNIRNPCPSSSCSGIHFSSELLLDEHVRTVHPGQKLFSCSDLLCSKSFALRRHLDRHIKFHHEAKKVFTCDRDCGKKFSNEKNLIAHQESCEGVQIFECQVCCKKSSNLSSHNLHLKIHNDFSQRRTYRCNYPECNKSYTSSSHLKQHQFVHSSNSFVCEKCGKSFGSERYLKDHSLVHDSKEKSNLCPHCGKSFLRMAGLTKHLRTHSDQRDYKCNVCQKTFKYSESLRLHFLLQHQEKQFICSVCGASFPYRFNLQKHMKTLHPHQEFDEDQP